MASTQQKYKSGRFGGFGHPLQDLISLTPGLLRLPFCIRNNGIEFLGSNIEDGRKGRRGSCNSICHSCEQPGKYHKLCVRLYGYGQSIEDGIGISNVLRTQLMDYRRSTSNIEFD
jgi:hypothetical protein